MTTRTTILALMGVAILTLAAVAAPVVAKPGEAADGGRQGAQDKQDKADVRREAAKEKAEQRGNATQERCLARHGNQSLNESDERKCMKHGEFAEKAYKARRASHALLGAINATERQWARLNVTEDRLEAKLAGSNLTANETARIEHRLEKIDAKQVRLEERLERLQERLAHLHAKWAAVRDHVDERRSRHRGDGDSSSSSSVSESVSSSASSSSAPA